jgi:hypothetical protein
LVKNEPSNQGKDLAMQNSTPAAAEKGLGRAIKIDEGQIQQHLGEMVRSTVEEAPTAMLGRTKGVPYVLGNARQGIGDKRQAGARQAGFRLERVTCPLGLMMDD